LSADGFVYVTSTESVPPGGFYRFELDGTVRILVRAENAFYALGGICTHEYAELCDGEIEGRTLWCPLHSAGYDVPTGQVTSPPAETPLAAYQVEVRAGAIYVSKECIDSRELSKENE
jgi:nitrite reductase/ring-hydroxylating ferredoxin subunit